MKFSSLTTKLILLVIVLVGLSGTVTAFIVYRGSSNALQSSISNSQLATADQIMDKLDRYLYERDTEIATATSREQVIDYFSGPADDRTSTPALEQDLQAIKRVTAAWTEINIFDTKGHRLASTSSNQPAVQTVIEPTEVAAYERAVKGELLYSDAFLTSDSKVPTVAFMSPIRASGESDQTVGVMEGELAWPTVLEILQSLTSAHATLLNEHGKLLGSNNGNNSQAGILVDDYHGSPAFRAMQSSAPGSSILPGLADPGSSYVASYVKEAGYLDYRGNHWSLIVETSKKVAFSPVTKLARTLTLTYALFLIGSVAIFILALNRLVLRPVLTLRAAVRRLAGGDFSQVVHVTSHDELGELGTGFNEMAQSLQDSGRNLQEEQAKLRASIEGLVLGFVLVDRTNKLVIQNKMLQTIFEATEPFTDLQQLETQLIGFDLAAICKTTQESGMPVEVGEVSLGSKILHLQLSPVKVAENGKAVAIGTVILVEDITEAKVMARSKDEFFSIASHELRTPLTAIMGNASMIIDYHADVLKDPDMKEMVYDIHKASERLIGIVGDFMDVSGLEQGKVVFKPEEFSLGAIVETVVYEMRTILEEKHLSLAVEPKTLGTLPPVWADKGRTKQILYNLVSNALKYTDKGGASIHISTEDDFMKIQVSDTGNGISLENQKLLFRKLQQAGDSLLTRDTTRGTGLGLYICKILAERMGGTIALESSVPGEGSTFSVKLPLASAARTKASEPTDATHTDTNTGLST